MKFIVTAFALFFFSCLAVAQSPDRSTGGDPGGKAPVSKYEKSITIKTADIKNHIGKVVRICDKVENARLAEVPKADRPTELFVGGDYPNHVFTLVIPQDVQVEKFRFDPEKKM